MPVVVTCTAETGPRPTTMSAGVVERRFWKSSTTRGVPSPSAVTASIANSPFPVSVTLAPFGSLSARTAFNVVATLTDDADFSLP